MKKTIALTRLAAFLALTVSSQTFAAGANLDVTFTATLRETTCDMKIEGGTGDGKANIIPIGAGGKTSLADITSGSDSATTAFKLKIIECPSSLAGLKTTVSGTASTDLATAIMNAAATNMAEYMGVSIARASAPMTPFTINATEDAKRLVWSPQEISSQEVALVARLVETKTDQATTGDFSAIATFNFEYQ
ncbi:fimbrial protein [Enterobacter asburiae]|uniref:fimbrial protein n=1 Tax=Enterobacter asburiae TaxID=61645 RepID=UPI0011D21A4C|nr:fimbrial protein [Enterobacter asburiae]